MLLRSGKRGAMKRPIANNRIVDLNSDGDELQDYVSHLEGIKRKVNIVRKEEFGDGRGCECSCCSSFWKDKIYWILDS